MRSWGSYTNTYWALGAGASVASPRLRTPPNCHLLPSNPLIAPLGQMLALGNQTLMDWTGEHRDAVPADLVAEVLTGHAGKDHLQRIAKHEKIIHDKVVEILV